MLLVAVLAVHCVQVAQAEWVKESRDGIVYFYDKTGDYTSTDDGLTLIVPDQFTGEDRMTPHIAAESTSTAARTVYSITVDNGATLTMSDSLWPGNNKYFGNYTIQNYIIGDGTGAGSFALTQKASTVSIEKVAGTLNSVNNEGTLTIGAAGNTTALSGSISNGGTLNLKGTFTASSLSGFSTTTYGALSNTTHGYAVGKEATVIASGGTINTSDFSFTLGETDITESLMTDSGNVLYIAEGAASSTSTIYEITSAYTTAVEYNGTSGDTAGATGFKLANGTTVKLTGSDYSGLTDGIRIAAGNDGSATVSIANGVSQTYASLSLGSLVTKESGSYVLNIDGTGTVVTTNHSSTNGYGFHTGEISITNGGKLLLDNYDSLGWEGNATSRISILNGTLALSGRQTFSTDLDMQGNAIIAANTTTLADNPPKIDVWTNMDWTVSGTGNEVRAGVAVNMRAAVNLNVETGGELSIKGAFEGSEQLTKSGEGKLVLDGVDKTINGQLQMTGGTLQLGGTTASDGLVTLAGGINHTAGTVQVAGKAAITGDSVLGGALVVDSTGNLTLGKTYTLTGSLSIAEGGKLIGATGMTTGESTAPAAGTNGWDSSIVTVLQTADDNVSNISGLDKFWWTDGNAYDISSSSSEGVTSYTASVGVNYYVQDTTIKAEYSTESGLTRAGVIYMSDDTTLVVKENLSTNKVSVAEGAAVNYEVDGATLTIPGDGTSNTTIYTNIKSVSLTNEATFAISNAFGSVGTEEDKVAINMSGNSLISLNNGNTWSTDRNLWADILINGDARIGGSSNGNYATVRGTIAGNGTLALQQANGTNNYTVASTISDGTGEGDKLAVSVNLKEWDSTANEVTTHNYQVVNINGANTYSGGTTITSGEVNTGNESALGTGKVSMNGGKLTQSTALSISAMDYTGGTVNNNGQNLTVTGKLTAAIAMSIEGDGDTELGSLDLTAGTTLSVAGSLTIGELILDLEKYTDYTRTYTLVTTTGTDDTVGLTTAYSAEYKGYTAEVSGSGTNSLTLSFSEIVAPGGRITTTVLGQGGFADGMLTLNVDGNLTDATQVLISGISDGIMAEILGLSDLPADGMVGITLQGAEGGAFTATADQMIGFQGKDGVSTYFGENVDGKWVYQVAYIPEPATATLSLLALAGLAARRRRKA